jgi:hypothetical protein
LDEGPALEVGAVFDGLSLIKSLLLLKERRLDVNGFLLRLELRAGLVDKVVVPERESLAERSKTAVFLVRQVVSFLPNKSLNSLTWSPLSTRPSLFLSRFRMISWMILVDVQFLEAQLPTGL